MKKVFLLCILVAAAMELMAQTPVDHFNVGPYVVDYNGKGDVKYRLRDNIDLYEFFELQKDTVVISKVSGESVKSAVQISARYGSSVSSSNELGVDCVWKRNIAPNLYFNGGLSLLWGYHQMENGDRSGMRNLFEAGIPLQIELGRLDRKCASLYGIAGVIPSFYSTKNTFRRLFTGNADVEGILDGCGFLLSPVLEFGGNIPVGGTVVRIGVYGEYKINCTSAPYGSCRSADNSMFIGTRIGVVL
ncbi:MAG: hypothetical protein IAC23_08170 [Bacteroidetes bacterium]|uniref:Outer membrane protein beta-barrel domain-containing protein n=1 Tax=Candidatus Cryptobacteroides merdavium TaxID=2840769 RepID=A0A9D9EDV4_9BACT|nr:hypothetical protein [Candidatus Cryptobacteroides merdavium]